MPRNNESGGATSGGAKFWLMQQGGRFWIEESAAMPKTEPEPGERMIVQRGAFDTRADAEKRMERFGKLTAL